MAQQQKAELTVRASSLRSLRSSEHHQRVPRQEATVTLDKDKQTATLTVNGILNDYSRGCYLGRDFDGRKYAATQSEATGTRPCVSFVL
jgi:hypothetical protein